jgi:predicted metal-dependent phosphoesterase TrpH
MSNVITKIDLHTHSQKSDGSLTPSELVDAAISANVSAFALTDHDTTAGLKEALEYAKDKPIRIIPGIEISTSYGSTDIHILGLFINHTSPLLQQHLESIIEARNERNIKMCNCFEKFDIHFKLNDLIKENPDSVITRAHYARYLYKHGYTKSIKEAFERYIGDHGPCYVSRNNITPELGIKIILEAGGLPILAHPVLYAISNQRLETLVSELSKVGLVGIETTYSTYTNGDTARMKKLAKKYNLLESGGSDFHGSVKPTIKIGSGRGQLFVPSSFLEDLEARLPTK